MPQSSRISAHYTRGDLGEKIRAALAECGKEPGTITLDDLGAFDEFHIGGRQATIELLGPLQLKRGQRLLDVGCGLGGPARFVASNYDCDVTGIDLTAEFVEVGTTLSGWVGLQDRVRLREGSALAMPFADETFEAAYMLHVGMNIEDKPKLFSEVHRVLKQGGTFAIYDVMQVGDGELKFPVPWAQIPEQSALSSPKAYRQMLIDQGFTVSAERDRLEFALAFFAKMQSKAAAGDTSPLNLRLVIGENMRQRIENLVANLAAGLLAPVEMIAQKA